MRFGLCRLDVSMHSLLMQVDTVIPASYVARVFLHLKSVGKKKKEKILSSKIVSVWFYYMACINACGFTTWTSKTFVP